MNSNFTSNKLYVARAQLGTALQLFIENRDPYSIQALACGAGELIEGIAQQANLPVFSSHIMQTYPDLNTLGAIKRIRNKYWNAFKHFYEKDNQTPRDDEEIITQFSDECNDAALYVGWQDYATLTGRLPVTAQVFHVWWCALNEDKLNPTVVTARLREIFPNIAKVDRREQKRRLRRKIESYRKNKQILEDHRTEIERTEWR